MAFEAVVFPQDPAFTYGCKNDYFFSATTAVGAWGTNNNNYGLLQAAEEEEEKKLLEIIINNNNMDQEQNLHSNNWDSSSHTSPEACTFDQSSPTPFSSSRRKRRRTKSAKNMEEIENQRMTHIAVERNRRKQMNEYLSALRSLMPSSYVQRGDQASIIGGAINFVKELEQLLQSMEGQKKTDQPGSSPLPPFAEFFVFPQYTTRAATHSNDTNMGVADIEVTLVDSHANLKILSKKRRGNLMKIIGGIQSLSLTILHLNVTTVDDLVLYSVSLKVEEECQLSTVDEIAAAVNQLLSMVGEEVTFS